LSIVIVTKSLLYFLLPLIILPLIILPCVIEELDPVLVSEILACTAGCALNLAQLLLGFIKLELL
jgi:hypothetical protein